jgi:integrase
MPHLTEDFIDRLPLKLKAYKVTDQVKRGKGCVGLCIRVTPGGAKTYALQYRTPEGKGWLPIGPVRDLTLEQARLKAQGYRAAIAQGRDPAKERRENRKAATVGDLVYRFVRDYLSGKAPRTAIEYERVLNKFVLPALGKRPVNGIGTADLAEILEDVRKNSGLIQANRLRSVLSKMFSKAEVWEMGREPGGNPVRVQDRSNEVKRDRRMTEGEVLALGATMREDEGIQRESVWALACIRLALLTAMRKGELLSLRWEWVDLDGGFVTIPPEYHKTGRCSGRAKVVYLCSAARTLLQILPRDERINGQPNPYVFAGRGHGTPLVQIQDTWDRIRTATTRRAKEQDLAMDIMDVTIHDLRRTFSSVGADLGIPELFLAAMLGHAAGTTTQGYARVSSNPIKEAVETIGTLISGWLDGQ